MPEPQLQFNRPPPTPVKDDSRWSPQALAEVARIETLRQKDLAEDKIPDQERQERQDAYAKWNGNPDDPLRTGPSFLQFATNREANEAKLLGAALYSDAGAKALQVIQPVEFSVPLNRDIAKAIVYQYRRGEPHDAAAVSDMLREAGRLPARMDPQACLVKVDPREYGIGAYETYAPMPAMAPGLAQAVRAEYRGRYLEESCEETIALARGGIEYGPDGLPDNDLAGDARRQLAEKLVAMPKELGPDLKERASTGSSDSVATWDLEPVEQKRWQVPPDLHLVPPPVLSAAGQAVVHR